MIAAYDELAERVRASDAVTHRLLTKILAAKLTREDEIEAVLTERVAAHARAAGQQRGPRQRT